MTRFIRKFNVLAAIFSVSWIIAGCTLSDKRDNAASLADPQPTEPAAAFALHSPELEAAIDTAFVEPSLINQEPEEIWEPLREGFQLVQVKNPRIDTHVRWFQNNPAYLDRVFSRGEPYLAWIYQQVAERDMPTEIALLPVVESGFNPFAYSHGRAAGLWQFIPGTGQHFGLEQNWWYDGRRDVVAATEAALDYLEQLHRRFDGDWMLALAAYNAGQGNVNKAVRSNERNGKPVDFFSLNLPRETQEYVPKLIALSKIVNKPGKYGLSLPSISPDIQLETVETGGQIDLALAADMAGIPLDTMYRFNPGFNRWATAPNGPHHLAVPVDVAETLQSALDELPNEDRVQWVRHQVKPGQTLTHIARDYHTTVAVLKDVNDISSSSIRAGQYLLIPKASRDLSDYSLSAVQREKERLASSSGKGVKVMYTVQSGDTLWDIAREYKVGVRSLAKWNGMAPGDTLTLGKQLVIWSQTTKTANPGQQLQKVYYTVRRGDSLARISQRFRVSLDDIRRWNNEINNKKYLKPGESLTLYVDVTRQSS